MENGINWENVANALQQRIAQVVAQYEGQMAIMNAQIVSLQEYINSEDDKTEPELAAKPGLNQDVASGKV